MKRWAVTVVCCTLLGNRESSCLERRIMSNYCTREGWDRSNVCQYEGGRALLNVLTTLNFVWHAGGKPIGCKWYSWGVGDWDLLVCFAHLSFRIMIAELLWSWCQEEKQTVRISKAILIWSLHISSLFSCTSTFYGLLACFVDTHKYFAQTYTVIQKNKYLCTYDQ